MHCFRSSAVIFWEPDLTKSLRDFILPRASICAGEERGERKVEIWTTEQTRTYLRVRGWLPACLGTWCGGCFPCSRPPESGRNANSPTPRASLTYKKTKSVSKYRPEMMRFRIFTGLDRAVSHLRCQKRKCPILRLDRALSRRKVVRSQSR